MIIRLLKLLFAILFLLTSIAHAAWTGFDLNFVSSPLPYPLNTDITDSSMPVFLNGTVILGGDPSKPIYSFTNKSGSIISGFKLTLVCVAGTHNECDDGDLFLGSSINKEISGNVFTGSVIGNTQKNIVGGLYTWPLEFSGGSVLPGGSFAMFDRSDLSLINEGLPKRKLVGFTVPEPASILLISIGLAGIIFITRRRNSSSQIALAERLV